MEKEGCRRCFAFLNQLGLKVSVFISDRHTGIAKWINDSCKETKHFFFLTFGMLPDQLQKSSLRPAKKRDAKLWQAGSKGFANICTGVPPQLGWDLVH